jgi:hypothetical protein
VEHLVVIAAGAGMPFGENGARAVNAELISQRPG